MEAQTIVTKALDGITFEVEKGEFTAIMGASGSGKSTLLNVISTIDRVSAGDIFIEQNNIAKLKESQLSDFRRDKLGFIFQEYNLLDTLTVAENIALPLNLKKTDPKTTKKKVDEVAESSQIQGSASEISLHELSGRAAAKNGLREGIDNLTCADISRRAHWSIGFQKF